MKRVVIAVTIFLLMGCKTNKVLTDTATNIPSFDYEGHRGCRGLMPENTIPAYLKGLQLGITTLEMDAVITKDKQVIMSHEPFFNHEITTKPDGSFIDEKDETNFNIYRMSYVQTQQFDVGLKPHPRFPKQQKLAVQKPLLSNVIDSVENFVSQNHLNKPYYNIETKCKPETDNIYHPEPAAFVELLMTIINDKKIADRVIIQSFDIRSLQYLHQHYPQIKTAYLFEPPDNRNLAERLKALGFIPTIYSPDYSTVNALLVKQCKELGMKLIPWTVDDIATMQQLKTMGVDGLISDYPNLYKNLKN